MNSKPFQVCLQWTYRRHKSKKRYFHLSATEFNLIDGLTWSVGCRCGWFIPSQMHHILSHMSDARTDKLFKSRRFHMLFIFIFFFPHSLSYLCFSNVNVIICAWFGLYASRIKNHWLLQIATIGHKNIAHMNGKVIRLSSRLHAQAHTIFKRTHFICTFLPKRIEANA